MPSSNVNNIQYVVVFDILLLLEEFELTCISVVVVVMVVVSLY